MQVIAQRLRRDAQLSGDVRRVATVREQPENAKLLVRQRINRCMRAGVFGNRDDLTRDFAESAEQFFFLAT